MFSTETPIKFQGGKDGLHKVSASPVTETVFTSTSFVPPKEDSISSLTVTIAVDIGVAISLAVLSACDAWVERMNIADPK
jgi:hypothetical protein